MMKRVGVVLSGILLAGTANALSCLPIVSSDEIDQFEHIFVAKIVSARYVPYNKPESPVYGVVVGDFEVEEVLKGDPKAVTDVRSAISKRPLAGSNHGYLPVGHSFVIFSEKGGSARFDACHRHIPIRSDRDNALCYIKKHLGFLDDSVEC